MSDSSSVFSCSSSDSDLFDDLDSDLDRSLKPKRTDNLLKRLATREIGLGYIRPTFPHLPDRLKFPLHRTLPTSSLSSHVFLGLSKCGQLLLTYTYTTDVDDRSLCFNAIFKYRLHWWAFVPYARARKVAEVTLFGNHSVYTPLYLAVCQWPSDPTKIVVYGNCETYVGLVGQTERSYVTITAVPSLHNCMECQKVAASFEEEDIAASWDSCVRFSCLVHGLTVHTSFDVAPPYPKFQPTISMKSSGCVVLNTGNFLHIIELELENSPKTSRPLKTSHDHCNAHSQSDQLIVRVRSSASNLNVRMSEYQTLLGIAPASPFATSSDHTSYDSRSLLEELNITCQGYIGTSSTLGVCHRPDLLMLESDSDASSHKSTILSPPLRRRNLHLLSPSTSPRGQHGRLNNKADAGKAYEFTEKDERIYETLSSFRKRRLADKKYEFSEEDFEDSENIVPFRLVRNADGAIMKSPTHPLPPPSLSLGRDRGVSVRTGSSLGEPPDLIPNCWRKSDSGGGTVDAETTDVLSPNSFHLDIGIDQEKVVLRPQNRNHALLSPREQDVRDPTKDSNKKAVQVHFDNNSLTSTTLSSPPHSYQLRTLTDKSDKVCASSVSGSNNSTNVGKVSQSNQIAGAQISECDDTCCKGRCTVQFERRFIEVDDELVSVITDIEDDDESGSTGYHSALPLEVHGSGYVQMQMISNSKAEKLMAPCALVRQKSFDIEQFCHEVAEMLCDKSGMKFWYCNNYDVEVIDVCPQSRDVICLAFMKIKATGKSKGTSKSERLMDDRQQYQTSCMLVWNMDTGMYRVERSGTLERLESTSDGIEEVSADYQTPDSPESADDWNPARKVAHDMRLRSTVNCTAANQPPVRVLSNAPALKGLSLLEIRDEENGLSFVL